MDKINKSEILPWLMWEYLSTCEKDADWFLFRNFRPERFPDDGMFSLSYRDELLRQYAAKKWTRENNKEYSL